MDVFAILCGIAEGGKLVDEGLGGGEGGDGGVEWAEQSGVLDVVVCVGGGGGESELCELEPDREGVGAFH